MDLLSPFETIEPVSRDLDPEKAGRLQTWRLYHQAFLLEQTLGPKALLGTEPGRLDVAPYQLVPVKRALESSRPRLLLADGVGLGKTIQAGLVLAELIARRRAHRILIVTPAGPLMKQWKDEMQLRFGLRFRELDQDSLQEIRRANELGVNPFDRVALGLSSIDFLKQERVLQELERSSYDVIVIDEAHHCSSLGNAGDREDSLRRRLAEVLARQCDGLLLLTATPHDGYDAHFASLIELLDPSLVDGRGNVRGDAYRRYLVRRLKSHIKDPATGADLFKPRKVHPCPVTFNPETSPRYSEFHRELLGFVVPHFRRAIREKRYEEVLAFLALLKRSVSSVAACRRTLQVVEDRYKSLVKVGEESQESRKQRLQSLRQLRRRLGRYGSLSWEEERDQAVLEAEDIASEVFASDADLAEAHREARRGQERQKRLESVAGVLTRLGELAVAAEPEDPKLPALEREIVSIRANEPHANLIVYTEYADTQDAVVRSLKEAVAAGRVKGEVLSISGADPDKVRIQVTERFGGEDDLILVSTDATAEGLNLHQRCHHLLHVELPYNPNRLEQRNGRIDRYGQAFDPQVRYLYLTGTFEQRILLKLVAKFERQRRSLTFMPNTLGVVACEADATTTKLVGALAEEEGALFKVPDRQLSFEQEAEVAGDTAATRELLDEIARVLQGVEKGAKASVWAGDGGVNAEPRLVAEAAEARQRAESAAGIDLITFVRDAVVAEDGAVKDLPDKTIEMRLPATWTRGLEDVFGFEPATRLLRVTKDRRQFLDAEKRPLAFLGRAHPVVRTALDRVRNQQFGAGNAPLDRRVTAAQGDKAQPELLLTYLGVVTSAAGSEYERVLAVRLGKTGDPTILEDISLWRDLMTDDRAVAPKGIWSKHFASWGPGRIEAGRAAGQAAFDRLAAAVRKDLEAALQQDRDSLSQWLRVRADAICGAAAAAQGNLFGAASLPEWKTAAPPLKRLAALAADGSVPAADRREAGVVLSLHEARTKYLDRRGEVKVQPVAPLGLLMLVPSGGE